MDCFVIGIYMLCLYYIIRKFTLSCNLMMGQSLIICGFSEMPSFIILAVVYVITCRCLFCLMMPDFSKARNSLVGLVWLGSRRCFGAGL
jgi:hypothetical protein